MRMQHTCHIANEVHAGGSHIPFLGCCTARPFRGKVNYCACFCCKAWSHENAIGIDHSVDEACANRQLASYCIYTPGRGKIVPRK